jgi:hypothetical protein
MLWLLNIKCVVEAFLKISSALSVMGEWRVVTIYFSSATLVAAFGLISWLIAL